jgi:hypothetical protein
MQILEYQEQHPAMPAKTPETYEEKSSINSCKPVNTNDKSNHDLPLRHHAVAKPRAYMTIGDI